MRRTLKTLGNGLATVLVLPALVSFAIRRAILGPNRALEGSTQALALVPGLPGVYLRRAFLRRTLAYCDWTASVQFGSIFSQVGARLEAHVYIGQRCHIGLVHLERDVLVAAGTHIPSGPHTHGTARNDVPMGLQEGRREVVRIGTGSWIGSGAIVMASVGVHAIVGAGSVVTRPVPDLTIAAGNPARVLRSRAEIEG